MPNPNSNLDAFITTSRPPPKPLAISSEIKDRDSIFTAYIFRATSRAEANSCVSHVRHVIHANQPATHEMSALRYMTPKKGKTGLDGPDDFEVVSGQDDDGETYGAGRILGVLEKEKVVDVVVVCSRWFVSWVLSSSHVRGIISYNMIRYGGTMLGPIRFTHIEKCTLEVCYAFKIIEKIEECIIELESYDETIANLRAEIAALSGTSSPQTTATKYEAILLNPPDLAKARRLLNARKGAMSGLQKTLESKKQAANKVLVS